MTLERPHRRAACATVGRNMIRDFLSIATTHSILRADLAEQLQQEADRTGENVESLVTRKNLLSAVRDAG